MMWRRLLPSMLGSSSAILPCTLVATTIRWRLPLRFSAAPVTSSLRPRLYTLAVSRKLMPASIARSMIANESCSPVLPPNIMQPRQRLLTLTPVRPSGRYSMVCRSCMLEGTRRRHNCFAQQQDRLDLVGVGHVEGHVLRANLHIALQTFDDFLGRANQVKLRAVTLLFRGESPLVSRNQDRDIIRTGNLVVWPAYTLAVLAEHCELMRNRLRVTANIAEVGVLRDEPEGDLLAAPPDHDRRPRLLHRRRVIVGIRNTKVLAAEACRALRHHAVDDLNCLLEHLHTLTNRRERPAVGQELDIVPGRAET